MLGLTEQNRKLQWQRKKHNLTNDKMAVKISDM